MDIPPHGAMSESKQGCEERRGHWRIPLHAGLGGCHTDMHGMHKNRPTGQHTACCAAWGGSAQISDAVSAPELDTEAAMSYIYIANHNLVCASMDDHTE